MGGGKLHLWCWDHAVLDSFFLPLVDSFAWILTHSLSLLNLFPERHCCAAISTSITPAERLEAVLKARDSFLHDSQSVHDEEMSTGADAAITKHLTFLVYHSKHLNERNGIVDSEESLRTEICLTLEVMECLYRASSQIVGASFQRMGNEVMHLLITIMDDEINRRQMQGMMDVSEKMRISDGDEGPRKSYDEEGGGRSTPSLDDGQKQDPNEDQAEEGERSRPITPPNESSQNEEGDKMLRKATKILGHCARAGEDTKPMAHFPGLLGSFVNLIALRPYYLVPWEARLSALWTMANLACNADCMQMMACTPGLVDALVDIACRPLRSNDPVETAIEVLRSRSIASRAILNLSWKPENKVLLSDNKALIDLLAELTVHRTASPNISKSRTVQEILVTTRRHAAGALRNLAAAPRRVKIFLCSYKDGHLLDVLTDAALNDPDSAVKDRAFATFNNLAIQDTAQFLARHPALVLALKDVLLSSEESMESDTHTDGTPKDHASKTLLVLERSITPSMDSYENLRDLLDALNPTPASGDGREIDNANEVAAV